jgi:membrane fusion protein, multidrug efflux system
VNWQFWPATLLTICLALVPGCARGPGKVGEAGPPVVPVSNPVQRDVTDFVEFTGRTNAKEPVSIQPRVTGYVVKIPFKEGSYVKEGELLFEIDPRPYQAQYDAALAQVAINEASKKYAVATNERFKVLAKKQPGAVSDRELDQYQALEDQAQANLELAKANLTSAKLNLDWTKVTSPIDGRISRYYLTTGNLVNQDVTQLTTVVSMDPIYVYFDMDESTFLRINSTLNEATLGTPKQRAEMISGLEAAAVGFLSFDREQSPFLAACALAVGTTMRSDVPVQMGVQGEAGYPHLGHINFIDNQVNPGTGSIQVRGVFRNPPVSSGTQQFVPGMFVRVRLPIGQPHPALLVIDRAVTSDQAVKYVYVYDPEKKFVEQRRVTTGPLQDDGLRVITQGLQPGDKVVIGSLQQMRPNMKIQPELMSMPSLGVPAEKEGPTVSKTKG